MTIYYIIKDTFFLKCNSYFLLMLIRISFILGFVGLFYQFVYKEEVFTSNTNHMLV